MKKLIFLMLSAFIGASVHSQGGFAINTTGAAANTSSILDVSSTNKGILIPRVALTDQFIAAPVTSPANALLVYNTATVAGTSGVSPGYYYWNATNGRWTRVIADREAWKLQGNSGIDIFNDFLGTTDAASLKIRTNSLPSIFFNGNTNFAGIGTETPGDNLVLKINSRGFSATTTGYAGLHITDASSTTDNNTGLHIGLNSAATVEARIMNYNAGDFWLGQAGYDIFHMKAGSRFIGINENSPNDNLSIRLNAAGINPFPEAYAGISMYGPGTITGGNNVGLHIGMDQPLFSTARIMNHMIGDLWMGAGNNEILRLRGSNRFVGINNNAPLQPVSLSLQNNGYFPNDYQGFQILSPNNGNVFNSGFIIGSQTNFPYKKGIWNYDFSSMNFGTDNTQRMIITEYGDVGIGTATPAARLHVADSNVVFTMNSNPFNINAYPPVSGFGTRFMWFVNRAALRVGYVNGPNWNRDSIGFYSFALGEDTKARGFYSIAMGRFSSATVNYSIAMGNNCNSYGYAGIALGDQSSANAVATALGSARAYGFASIAIGNNTEATGDQSISLGTNAIANAEGAISIGILNSSTFYSNSIGYYNTTSIPYSTGLGYQNNVTGLAATSIGFNNYAKAVGSTTIGLYNNISDIPNPNSESSTDRIFQIGNGSYATAARSNAITVLRNANTGINVLSPNAKLSISSNGNELTGTAMSTLFRSNVGSLGSSQGTEISIANFGYEAGINNASLGIHAYRRSAGTDWTTTSILFGMDVDNTTRAAGGGSFFSLNSTGSFGISNANPRFPLTFAAVLGDKISLWDDGTNTYHYGLGIQSGLLQLHTDLVGSDIVFGYGSSGAMTENVRFKGNGNVGIGTNAPSQKLHVIGNILASGTITPSDIRYKKNIRLINSPVEKLKLIRGVTYQYKSKEFPGMGFTDGMQMGFIAQEVEKVFPELVTTDDKGYKYVDYPKITPVMLEAIKEQQQEIDNLTKRIEKLEKLLIQKN